jgi:hypothetical protein
VDAAIRCCCDEEDDRCGGWSTVPSATASHRRGRSRATPWGRSRAVPLATTTPCHVVPCRRPPPRAVLCNAVGHHLARHPYAREREGGPALLLCTPMALVGEDRAEKEGRRLACPGRERKEKEEKKWRKKRNHVHGESMESFRAWER